MSKVSTDDGYVWPREWGFTLGEVRTRGTSSTTKCTDVSKVAREIDEGLSCVARSTASRLESRTYSSLYDRYAACAVSNGCLFQNARSRVDRTWAHGTARVHRRGGKREGGYTRFKPRASLITNSRIGGHTHTKEENTYIYPVARVQSKFPCGARLADRICGVRLGADTL